jgi:Domain of unknown function (DUF4281)
MNIESTYQYASILILLPWAMMIFAPNRRYTDPVAFTAAVALFLAGTIYTVLFIRIGFNSGSFQNGSAILQFFRNKDMLLSGWFNYLSLCLLAGIWQNHDSSALKIPHIWVLPCLLLTMISGPVGILIYCLIRWVQKKK